MELKFALRCSESKKPIRKRKQSSKGSQSGTSSLHTNNYDWKKSWNWENAPMNSSHFFFFMSSNDTVNVINLCKYNGIWAIYIYGVTLRHFRVFLNENFHYSNDLRKIFAGTQHTQISIVIIIMIINESVIFWIIYIKKYYSMKIFNCVTF